jgi:hypothetical protein
VTDVEFQHAEGKASAKRGDVMTKAGRQLRDRKPKPVPLPDGCWVDLYEGPWFGGKLRRLRGPADFLKTPQFRSVIVGPQATVVEADKKRGATLRPRQIVPDAGRRFEGKLTTIRVLRVR